MSRTSFARAVVLLALVGMAAPGAGSAGNGPAARDGGARFLTGPNQGRPLDVALRYIQRSRRDLGLTAADLGDVVVTDQYVSRHTGVTHIYLRQRFAGIEVFGANTNVNVAADGSIVNLGSSFVGNLASAVDGRAATRSAADSMKGAARGLGLTLKEEPRTLAEKGGRFAVLSDAGISTSAIPAKLVYQPMADGSVRLAWQLEIDELGGQHWWNARVDARTGELLAASDYVSDADDAYNVFAQPNESPNDGPLTLETNPADPTASPFGWHDTNGAAGAEFTVTRGNNVHAYTDLNADNVADPGSDPDGGAVLVFDFGLDLTQEPSTYRPFAVTNLFYWNNVVHDVLHGYGFDEASGNFQVNNYERGGLGNDDVRAEAQDGSGINNANFGTPPDGSRPRMQMFVWRGAPELRVNAPPAIAGLKTASSAGFGPAFPTAGITSDVVLADDGTAPTSDACTALVNGAEIAGKIALLDRGTCQFSVKVKIAQDAGAVAVIVGNNVAGAPVTMAPGMFADQVTIPSTMVSLADGNDMKANLAGPVNVTIRSVNVSRDSDLDAGVIAHEYGHGVSNRLTGGPSTVTCLSTATTPEQMGEGWSDWLALVLTPQPGDTATTPRGIGTYLIFQTRTDQGIRPAQYTTDMAVNAYTYGRVATDTANGTLTIPHGVGFVWASMLWEVYWNLVHEHGLNPDVYGDWSTGGNNLAIQLVIDGMKLQPCAPGFEDGRDAILLADQLLTDGENQCEIWAGFAKRGLGLSADQGLSSSTTDGTEAFDLPLGCHFSGFFGSVHNRPALNGARSGSVVPVIFSLEGDRGLDIFAGGHPATRPIDCTTKQPLSTTLTPTSTPGGSALVYDAGTDRYTYPWRTSNAWAGTCQELRVRFADSAVTLKAYFQFS